jgi:ABC-type nitrate/sulfonate/bicarbonate transport system ATPase subunit
VNGRIAVWCFSHTTCFPWLTVRENIAFCLRECGISERSKIADGFIQRVGLAGFESHWPKQLSGGMQQGTAIARALANDPKIARRAVRCAGQTDPIC